MTVNSFLPRIVVAEEMSYVGEFPNVATTTGGPPLTQKVTNTVSTTMVFGLCTCKWGIFALVGDLLQSH